jgi:hypothetical protein
MTDPSYLPCDHLCMRASDVGVYVAGDPVAYEHPGCPVHGSCEQYVPSDVVHGCGLRPCANCKGYEDEHDYRKPVE